MPATLTLPPVATLPAVEASASASSLAPAILVATMPTPIGPLTVLAAGGIVRAGGFTEDVGALAVRLGSEHTGASLEMVDDLGTITEALAAYFAGDVRALDTIPVSQHGGPFQQRVWAALRTLPPGQLATYRDLGVQLGGPQFARAVGAGCASNLISPIVPCHRVTRTDGALAGYFWGLERKRWLLDHERRHGDHTRRPA